MTAPARDRIVGYKGPARVDDGDRVTYEYERPDGTRYERDFVFVLSSAGKRLRADTAT